MQEQKVESRRLDKVKSRKEKKNEIYSARHIRSKEKLFEKNNK